MFDWCDGDFEGALLRTESEPPCFGDEGEREEDEMKRFMELFDDHKKIQNFYGSKLIATYTNDLPKNDLDYVLEGLFKKEDGTFFLAGESGPRGRYAKNESLGGKVGGEDVYILSPEEAKEWIELTQGDNAANATLLLDGFAII
jgi:hypothetical protein